MSKLSYWDECVRESLSEAGLAATDEQIALIAGNIGVCHEQYDMVFYNPSSDRGESSETKRLKLELERERSKVLCRRCNGTGTIVTHGPIHSGYSQCVKCGGEGRHLP